MDLVTGQSFFGPFCPEISRIQKFRHSNDLLIFVCDPCVSLLRCILCDSFPKFLIFIPLMAIEKKLLQPVSPRTLGPKYLNITKINTTLSDIKHQRPRPNDSRAYPFRYTAPSTLSTNTSTPQARACVRHGPDRPIVL